MIFSSFLTKNKLKGVGEQYIILIIWYHNYFVPHLANMWRQHIKDRGFEP
jgi:hypothetical protein